MPLTCKLISLDLLCVQGLLHPAAATCWWDYCDGNERNRHLVSPQRNFSSGELHYKYKCTVWYLEIEVISDP